ncbi:hypothetical protein [Zavarzinia sp. CC-PAN008]|uniref:hypothetical protein n=1 Tax=Zavarzinia sp. CC-PAN008 TaxID=3243332 RepID=UPI003F745E50
MAPRFLSSFGTALAGLYLAAQPALAQEAALPEPTFTAACGAYAATITIPASAAPEDEDIRDGDSLVLTRDRAVVWASRDRQADGALRWTVTAPCLEIPGDPARLLLAYEWSGGAHCCITHHVFRLGQTLGRTHPWFQGNGDPVPLFVLDGQLLALGSDDVLAYWGGSYAGSIFPPVAVSFRYGRPTLERRWQVSAEPGGPPPLAARTDIVTPVAPFADEGPLAPLAIDRILPELVGVPDLPPTLGLPALIAQHRDAWAQADRTRPADALFGVFGSAVGRLAWTGHAEQAWALVNQVLAQEGTEVQAARQEFLSLFVLHAMRSVFWRDLLALNGPALVTPILDEGEQAVLTRLLQDPTRLVPASQTDPNQLDVGVDLDLQTQPARQLRFIVTVRDAAADRTDWAVTDATGAIIRNGTADGRLVKVRRPPTPDELADAAAATAEAASEPDSDSVVVDYDPDAPAPLPPGATELDFSTPDGPVQAVVIPAAG